MQEKTCNICNKPFGNFDAIGRYNGKDCHSDCFPKEKTLKEKFREKFGNNQWDCSYDEVLSFISSREEKAKEEGRKDGLKVIKNNIVEEICKEAITQYKEELLDKLDEEFGVLSNKTLICTKNKKTQSGREIESTNGLSEVKKLL
jgi:hypothetical protein